MIRKKLKTFNPEIFRYLVDSLPEIIYITDSDGQPIYYNKQWFVYTGANPKNIKKFNWEKTVFSPDLPFVKREWKKSHLKKTAFEAELRLVNRHGKEEWFLERSVPIKNSKGKIINWFGIATNINKRKHTEQKLKINEDKLANLSKASKILTSSIDYKVTLTNIARATVPCFADWIIIDIVKDNQTIDRVVVYHRNLKFKKYTKILKNKYPPKMSSSYGVTRVIKSGKSIYSPKVPEADIKNACQSLEHYRILKLLGFKSGLCLILKARKKILGAITLIYGHSDRTYNRTDYQTAQDLANRVAIAIDNSILFKKIQNAISLRDEFISVASHELKTPVTSIKVYSQALHKHFEKKDDISMSKHFIKMNNQIDNLLNLVNDLLDASRIEHGKLELRKELFDLNSLIRETALEMQETTRLKIEILGKIQKKVYGDRYRINQVIVNLLSNAIKYSPNSNIIKIHLTSEKDVAVVQVQDFGIGIDKTQLSHLFKRFFRVSDPKLKTYPGLGIGLFISNEIIKRHNGNMTVVSQKGKGSIFSFTIPFLTK